MCPFSTQTSFASATFSKLRTYVVSTILNVPVDNARRNSEKSS